MATTFIFTRCCRQVFSSATKTLRCRRQTLGLLAAAQNQRSFSRFSPALAGRLLSEDHEWIVMNGKIGTIGISDHAQDQLGDIVYVECPEVDREIEKSEAVATVESVKAVTEVFTPVSGKVVEINEELASDPGKVNKSCYDEGWLYKVELSDMSELDGLMSEEAYNKFLETLED